jgi:NTP pyrophosphatase (non-canonical NTP hydrolase)
MRRTAFEMIMDRKDFYALMDKEYNRQRMKYGQEFCDELPPDTWALILAEETGEVADAVLKMMRKPGVADPKHAKEECVHAAAVAMSTWLAIARWERDND